MRLRKEPIKRGGKRLQRKNILGGSLYGTHLYTQGKLQVLLTKVLGRRENSQSQVVGGKKISKLWNTCRSGDYGFCLWAEEWCGGEQGLRDQVCGTRTGEKRKKKA